MGGKFYNKKSEFNAKRFDLRVCHLPELSMRERELEASAVLCASGQLGGSIFLSC